MTLNFYWLSNYPEHLLSPKLGWTTSTSRATLQRRRPGGRAKRLLRLLMVKPRLLTKMQRQCNLLSVKFKRARCVRQNRRSLRPKRTRIRALTTDRHAVRTSEFKFLKLRIYNYKIEWFYIAVGVQPGNHAELSTVSAFFVHVNCFYLLTESCKNCTYVNFSIKG